MRSAKAGAVIDDTGSRGVRWGAGIRDRRRVDCAAQRVISDGRLIDSGPGTRAGPRHLPPADVHDASPRGATGSQSIPLKYSLCAVDRSLLPIALFGNQDLHVEYSDIWRIDRLLGFGMPGSL